jgi:hypothetical protein
MSVTAVQAVTKLLTSSPMLVISEAALFLLKGSSLIPGHKQKTKICNKFGEILPTAANRSAQRNSYPNELLSIIKFRNDWTGID